jgi:hypothetical protein
LGGGGLRKVVERIEVVERLEGISRQPAGLRVCKLLEAPS